MSMDFDLSTDQRQFQEAVGAFLSDTCSRQQLLSTFIDTKAANVIWRGLVDLGIPGIMAPEEFGGLNLELLDAASIAETLGRFGAPGPFAEHLVATACISWCGDEEIKQRWLPDLSSGAKRGTVAFFEKNEQWCPTSWTQPPGKQISKMCRFVPWADGADLVVVGLSGGRLGLVERGKHMQVIDLTPLDPTRRLYDVSLEAAPCRVLDCGPELAWRLFDMWLVLLAADAYGGAMQCLETTVAYAKERVQFRTPIGRFQGVKHQLADLALIIEPSVGLYWYAAHAFDREPERSPAASSMAKAHITDVYIAAARRAIELHGGIGYTWEYGAHIWLRRALYDRQFLGTPGRHRARLADLSGW